MQKVRVKTVNTPVGNLLVAVNEDDALCVVTFAGRERFEMWRAKFAEDSTVEDSEFDHPFFEQLQSYLARERHTFDVETHRSGTPFQQRVYEALQTIPYGTTWSYSQLAESLGDPDAVRAVGAANGQNPLALLNPCHRVIGSDGDLRGFAGGVDIKRALLELENADCVKQTSLF